VGGHHGSRVNPPLYPRRISVDGGKIAVYKSEYRQGKVKAMAGTSLNHNRIAKNACFVIDNALTGKPCESFMGDIRLWIEKKNLYTYPDVIVMCGQPRFAPGRTDTITNPKVIIEVLLKSTTEYDYSDKFHAYWTIDTFEEYVLTSTGCR
jgi:Uma2 family endonuclease